MFAPHTWMGVSASIGRAVVLVFVSGWWMGDRVVLQVVTTHANPSVPLTRLARCAQSQLRPPACAQTCRGPSAACLSTSKRRLVSASVGFGARGCSVLRPRVAARGRGQAHAYMTLAGNRCRCRLGRSERSLLLNSPAMAYNCIHKQTHTTQEPISRSTATPPPRCSSPGTIPPLTSSLGSCSRCAATRICSVACSTRCVSLRTQAPNM